MNGPLLLCKVNIGNEKIAAEQFRNSGTFVESVRNSAALSYVKYIMADNYEVGLAVWTCGKIGFLL